MESDWIGKTWISFIWTQSFPDQPREDEATFGALARPSQYKRRFYGLRQAQRDGRPSRSGLSLPWKRAANRRFWQLYTGGALENPSREWPWEKCVPFRLGLSKQVVRSEIPGVTISAESYLYAHGASLVMTLYLYGEMSLLERAGQSVDLLHSPVFGLSLEEGSRSGLELSDMAAELLAYLSRQAGAVSAYGQAAPFSLVSVLRGAPGFAHNAAQMDENTQRTLQALTTWRRSWKQDMLENPLQHRIKISSRKPEEVLYAGQRGRALWSPQDFRDDDDNRGFSTLRAYHRNLLMASMQTESLALHVQQQLDELDAGKREWLTDYTKEAACLLRGLYYGCYNLKQGREDTYRTWSVRAQIEQNHYIPNINRVLRDKGGEQLIPEGDPVR